MDTLRNDAAIVRGYKSRPYKLISSTAGYKLSDTVGQILKCQW